MRRVELVSYPGDLPWNGDQSHDRAVQQWSSIMSNQHQLDIGSNNNNDKGPVRKYSQPAYYGENPPAAPDTPRLRRTSPKPISERKKKHSLPNCAMMLQPVPIINKPFDDDGLGRV